MTVARVFVPPEKIDGPELELRDEAHRHLHKVLRLGVGARVAVFDGRGNEVEGEIIAIDRRRVLLRLGPRRTIAPPATDITLVQVVPRGERMDWLVQKTTELGVARIVPVESARSVVRFSGAREGTLVRWRTIAQEAARQCGRADVPEIEPPQPLLTGARAAAARCPRRMLLWEGDDGLSLPDALAAAPVATRAAPVAVLVGPEGGFGEDEAAALVALGFRPVNLGPRILRSETAAIVAVALAQAAGGGLSRLAEDRQT